MAGSDPGCFVGDEGFALGEGEAAAVGALRELGLERQTREGVDRVVEVEQEFRGLDAAQVGLAGEDEFGLRERGSEGVERGMVLDDQIAVGALVEAALTGVDDVERDAPGEHGRLREVLAEDGRVPQPVLEADDDRAGREVRGERGSAASAVAADFTVTSTRPAPAAASGSVAYLGAGTRASVPCRSVRVSPWAAVSSASRGRPTKTTSAPAAASRPPT